MKDSPTKRSFIVYVINLTPYIIRVTSNKKSDTLQFVKVGYPME